MTKKYDFEIKWFPLREKDGFTIIPNALIEHQADMKITPSEMTLIIALASFRWDNRKPWPSAATLSSYCGIAPHTVRTNLRNLHKKGLIKRCFRDGQTNMYDFEPLIKRLTSYTQPMQKRIPPSLNTNTPTYSKTNTKEEAEKKTEIKRRNRIGGKPLRIGIIASKRDWS